MKNYNTNTYEEVINETIKECEDKIKMYEYLIKHTNKEINYLQTKLNDNRLHKEFENYKKMRKEIEKKYLETGVIEFKYDDNFFENHGENGNKY